jgi:glutathione synthase
MKHAFIMNPLEGVKPWKDTTYFLMLACVERGHEVCYLDQTSLWLNHDVLCATVSWVNVNDDTENPFSIIKTETMELGDVEAVWVRTDPPFDRRYFYTTLLLDYLPDRTRVLNRPSGIRNWNEKLAALFYPEYTPKTVVTNNVDEIKSMAGRHKRITVKPVDGFGGKGIVFYTDGDDDREIGEATHQGSHWVIVQEYLAEASLGDKRILLLNGEPMGAILRLHADGVELNNLDAGGSANPASLDQRDLEICAAIREGLIEQGVFFAGIDIIGGMLIEVNVTSPTGLQEMSRFNQEDYHHQLIAALE